MRVLSVQDHGRLAVKVASGLRSGRHLPRRTLRLRLTLLYGGLFLACGAALLTITYVLVAHATVRPGYVRTVGGGSVGLRVGQGHRALSSTLRSATGRAVLTSIVRGQRISDLHQLVIWSGIALAIMAIIAAGLGWIVAGRALRPLRTITAATREISATNLHRRLALEAPNDELKDLGDTIDALLARLEHSFQAQRAFVANASHELRTPLTLSRAMLQFALADPNLTLESLKAACDDALDAGAEHEQLLDALLTLAQSQQQIERHEPFDIAPLVQDVIEARRSLAATHGVTIHAALHDATIYGDSRLTRQLIGNLLDNALLHNHSGGEARVTVAADARRTTLTVQNTGPSVAADQIDRLTQPFRRLTTDRTTGAPGHGLGLSIVAAIAAAHHATLDIRPNDAGGLHVRVSFPPPQPSGTTDAGGAPAAAPGLPVCH
jgi:signal transduction histidine kinase